MKGLLAAVLGGKEERSIFHVVLQLQGEEGIHSCKNPISQTAFYILSRFEISQTFHRRILNFCVH